MADGSSGPSSALVETVSGLTAGLASTIGTHPLDLLKTRLQLARDRSSRVGNSFRLLRQVVRQEHGLNGLYRGFTPNVIGNATSWSIWFLCYGQAKDRLRDWNGKEGPLSSSEYFLASGIAGIITAVTTNPIWVIKTRMIATSSAAKGAYPSVWKGVQVIYDSEQGARGFFRGLAPSLLGSAHGAVQFMVYEQLKNWRRAGSSHSNQQLPNLDYLVLSGVAKTIAGITTYPFQVLRSRMQSQNAAAEYDTIWRTCKTTYSREGLGGFYKGLGPNILRVLPATWITFLVYENCHHYLPKLLNRSDAPA